MIRRYAFGGRIQMRATVIGLMVLAISLALAAEPAWAKKKQEFSDEPINIISDKLDVDNQNQVAYFIGKVKATQGDLIITCDKLEVYYEREGGKAAAEDKKETGQGGGIMDQGGKVREVVALGHVKIVQKDRVAVGRKATYWAGGRKILLEGKATVWRGKNTVSGEKVTVFLDENRSVVHGQPGKRVTVTLTPGSQR
jgi:lipopolysaccharide export system protein LptA